MDISGRWVAGLYAGGVAVAAAFVLVVIPAIGGPGVWADVKPVAAVSEVARVDALRSVLGDVAVVCVDAPTSTCVPGRMDLGRIVLSEVTSDDPGDVVHEWAVARPVRDLAAFGWTSDRSDGCECLYPPLIVSV